MLNQFSVGPFVIPFLFSTQDGTVNVDKMTTEQKNSYLEAHMEVQQHMHHVSMQLNKPTQNHSTTHNQSMVGNQGIGGSHQSGSSANVSNPYLGANPIKVSIISVVELMYIADIFITVSRFLRHHR